jgi:hypothetical protein
VFEVKLLGSFKTAGNRADQSYAFCARSLAGQ